MTLVAFALAFVLVALLVYWIFSPWLLTRALASSTDPLLRKLERLHFAREMILENLQDLELDRQMGKIDSKDYENLRAKMMVEAAGIYESLQELENKDPLFVEIRRLIESKGISAS